MGWGPAPRVPATDEEATRRCEGDSGGGHGEHSATQHDPSRQATRARSCHDTVPMAPRKGPDRSELLVPLPPAAKGPARGGHRARAQRGGLADTAPTLARRARAALSPALPRTAFGRPGRTPDAGGAAPLHRQPSRRSGRLAQHGAPGLRPIDRGRLPRRPRRLRYARRPNASRSRPAPARCQRPAPFACLGATPRAARQSDPGRAAPRFARRRTRARFPARYAGARGVPDGALGPPALAPLEPQRIRGARLRRRCRLPSAARGDPATWESRAACAATPNRYSSCRARNRRST